MVDVCERLGAWCADGGVECVPSYSTMLRAWNTKWSKCLKMLAMGTQSKCNDCETFKQLRRLANSLQDHQRISAGYRQHLQRAVYRPRAIGAHLAVCSQRSLTGLIAVTDALSLLRSCMDAMEQAKLKLPSNRSMAKQFANMWRPNCLLIGSIAFNLLECFWVVEPTVAKDSNLEITLLGRLLELVSQNVVLDLVSSFKVIIPGLGRCGSSLNDMSHMHH